MKLILFLLGLSVLYVIPTLCLTALSFSAVLLSAAPLYDRPGGAGKVMAELPAGTAIRISECIDAKTDIYYSVRVDDVHGYLYELRLQYQTNFNFSKASIRPNKLISSIDCWLITRHLASVHNKRV